MWQALNQSEWPNSPRYYEKQNGFSLFSHDSIDGLSWNFDMFVISCVCWITKSMNAICKMLSTLPMLYHTFKKMWNGFLIRKYCHRPSPGCIIYINMSELATYKGREIDLPTPVLVCHGCCLHHGIHIKPNLPKSSKILRVVLEDCGGLR